MKKNIKVTVDENTKQEQEIEEGKKPTEVDTGGLHDHNEVNFDSTQITNPEKPNESSNYVQD